MSKNQTRQTVVFKPGSNDFDSPVQIGNVSMTLQAAQLFRGLLQCSPEASITLTFPTAAQLIAASPEIPIAKYCKRFSIRNDGRAPVTIIAGEGGVIDGSDTVSASNFAAHYVLRFTSVTSGVESYQIIRE